MLHRYVYIEIVLKRDYSHFLTARKSLPCASFRTSLITKNRLLLGKWASFLPLPLGGDGSMGRMGRYVTALFEG